MGEPEGDTTSASPEHRSDTHGARLAGRKDDSKRKLAEKVRLFEDSNEARLCMRRQIFLRVHAVVGFRNDLAIHCEEGTEGVIPITAGFRSQYEGLAQQGVLIHTNETSAETTDVRTVDASVMRVSPHHRE
jgi:hypothetical protein